MDPPGWPASPGTSTQHIPTQLLSGGVTVVQLPSPVSAQWQGLPLLRLR